MKKVPKDAIVSGLQPQREFIQAQQKRVADAQSARQLGARVVRTLWPPQAGTQAWLKQFGTDLVCVRYRRDVTGLYRYTTVECVVEQGPLTDGSAANKRLPVQVADNEHALRARLRIGGAKWDPDNEVWQAKGKEIQRLSLASRVKLKKNK